MAAAAGFHLITQRAYSKARGAFVVAAIALVVPVFDVRSDEALAAPPLVGFLLIMILRFVRDKENPEVATLTVGPEQVWAQEETKLFGVHVRLQNGAESMGFMPAWGLVLRAHGKRTIIGQDALQKHGGLGVVGSFTLTEHQAVEGFLTTTCFDAFPKGMPLHGVTFEVAVTPTRGRVEPKSFRVSGAARI
jgi:hypothetical protein